MSFETETRAIIPAWHRAVAVTLRSGVSLYFLALCLVLELGSPANEFPSILPAWADSPEVGELSNQSWNLVFGSFSQSAHSVVKASGVACVIVLFGVLLVLVFRVPFMRFDVISGRRTDLRETWRESGGLALQWCLFGLCAGIAGSALSGVLNLGINEKTLGSLPWGKILVTSKDIFWGTVTMYAYWFADDFLVPVLSIEGGEVLPAISRAWNMLRIDIAGLVRYLVVKTMLVIVGTFFFCTLWWLYAHAILIPLEKRFLQLAQINVSYGAVRFSAGLFFVALMLMLSLFVLLLSMVIASGFISGFLGGFALDYYEKRYPALHDLLQHEKTAAT